MKDVSCQRLKIVLKKKKRRIKLSFKIPEIVVKFNHFLRHFSLQCVHIILINLCYDRYVEMIVVKINEPIRFFFYFRLYLRC